MNGVNQSAVLAGKPVWVQALAAVALTIGMVVGALAIAAIVTASLVGELSDGAVGEQLPPHLLWLQLLVFQASVVFLVIAAAGLYGTPRNVLAFNPLYPNSQGWRFPFVVCVAVSLATSAIAYGFFWDIVQKDLNVFRAMMTGVPVWLPLLALAIGAPVSEEILFRGFLLGRLQATRLGFWGAAIISNAAWTALHANYSWVSLVDVFIAGLLFSWALWRTHSLWVPIAFHAIYNTVVFAFLAGTQPVPVARLLFPG